MVDYTWIGGIAPRVWKHKADATKDQVAVQNTWYTILDTTMNARILAITLDMETADETLECRITVDGVTYTSNGVAATAGTFYFVWKQSTGAFTINIGVYPPALTHPLEGHSVKVEMRKTTAAGANHLLGRVMYDVME